MAGYVRVSVQRLDQDSETIQTEIREISRSIEELAEEMKLLGQTWEGPAWQAYQNQLAADIENMQNIYKKLSLYIEHMEYAKKEYQNCEDQVGNLVDSIRI